MATYKIIGADLKEYGPITAEVVKKWIAEGRANAQTKVLPEGATEWVTVAQVPELNEAIPSGGAAPPAFPPSVGSMGTPAKDQVTGPAIGLIVTAILGFISTIAGIVLNLVGFQMGMNQPGLDPEVQKFVSMFSGAMGIISAILGLAVSGIVLFGALKMKKCESYGWAMTASILAIIPCSCPTCLIGLPIGIWALVVLSKPEVKAAFQ